MGDVVLTELLNERGLLPEVKPKIDVFLLIENEQLRPKSLYWVEEMRRSDLRVDYSITPLKLEKQFKRALESNATFTAKLEGTSDGSTTMKFQNLATREELRVSSVAEMCERDFMMRFHRGIFLSPRK